MAALSNASQKTCEVRKLAGGLAGSENCDRALFYVYHGVAKLTGYDDEERR